MISEDKYSLIGSCGADRHGRHANLIPVGGRGYRILGRQRYAAGGDHQEDGHFEIPEVHHIVTHSAHPGGPQAEGNMRHGPASMSADCDSSGWVIAADERVEGTHGLSCLKMNMLFGITLLAGLTSSSSSFSDLQVSGSLLFTGRPLYAKHKIHC